MASEPRIPTSLEEFTIHSLNGYTNVWLSSTAAMLDLSSPEVGGVIGELYREVVGKLAQGDVDYADLRWALTPRSSHAEIAFLFDSTKAGSHYGFEISKAWLPVLWSCGPKRTAISQGDLLSVPSPWVWRELDAHLVGPKGFPRLATEQYYVVHFTNMSSTQVTAVDTALRDSSQAYLGYVDCSTWTPLKVCMLLPQYAVRERSALIVPADEDGDPHITPPVTAADFRTVGIEQTLYGVMLDHRMDNGVPEWADDDSMIALTALGGGQSPLREMKLDLDAKRFAYLTNEDKGSGHGASARRAGLLGVSLEHFVGAIHAKLATGLIYNLRFKYGTREGGVPEPKNNALMFTTQVEFPDEAGKVRRYTVGIKYTPESHLGEIVTFH